MQINIPLELYVIISEYADPISKLYINFACKNLWDLELFDMDADPISSANLRICKRYETDIPLILAGHGYLITNTKMLYQCLQACCDVLDSNTAMRLHKTYRYRDDHDGVSRYIDNPQLARFNLPNIMIKLRSKLELNDALSTFGGRLIGEDLNRGTEGHYDNPVLRALYDRYYDELEYVDAKYALMHACDGGHDDFVLSKLDRCGLSDIPSNILRTGNIEVYRKVIMMGYTPTLNDLSVACTLTDISLLAEVLCNNIDIDLASLCRTGYTYEAIKYLYEMYGDKTDQWIRVACSCPVYVNGIYSDKAVRYLSDKLLAVGYVNPRCDDVDYFIAASSIITCAEDNLLANKHRHSISLRLDNPSRLPEDLIRYGLLNIAKHLVSTGVKMNKIIGRGKDTSLGYKQYLTYIYLADNNIVSPTFTQDASLSEIDAVNYCTGSYN